MVWKILRPQYWILDRKVRSTNSALIIALILLLTFGGQWTYDNLVRDGVELLNSEQAVTAIASSLPFALFMLLLFALLGVGDLIHQLYLTSDLELLMVAPIPYRTIFLVKQSQGTRSALIPALGFGAFLLALGLARDAAVSYYPLIVLLILSAMILITAVVMILVILLARFLPAQKVRSWMPVVVALATFVLILGQQAATQWFLGHTGTISFLTEALLNPGQLSQVAAGLAGLALVTSVVAYQAFQTSFHEGWNRFREVPTQRAPLSAAARPRWDVSRLVRPLSAPLRFFLVKEWLELRRSPRGLLNLTQPLVLVVVAVMPFLSAGRGAETLRPLVFWSMLLFLAVFLSVLPLGTSLTSIAQEGRKMALLRSAPISMSDVLRGKFWAIWVPTVLPWVLVFLIAGIWLRLPPWQIGFLVAITIWGLAGTSVATMAIGGLKVDFTAEELKQRTSVPTNYLVMGLNLVFVLWTIAAFAWLMARLFPDSPVVLAIEALAGFGPVGWIFTEQMWIPFGLVSGQVVFWIGAKVLWDAAARRLEGWEGI